MLLSKYTKFFIDIIPPSDNVIDATSSSLRTSSSSSSSPVVGGTTDDASGEFDQIISNELSGNNNRPIECGITQWEILADAILATPITRFVEPTTDANNDNGNE